MKDLIINDFTGNRAQIRRWFEQQGCSPSLVKYASKSDFLACVDSPKSLDKRVNDRLRANPVAKLFDDEPSPVAAPAAPAAPAVPAAPVVAPTADAKAALAQIQAALASLMPAPAAAPAAPATVDIETVRRLIQDELKNWTIQIEGAPVVQLSGKPHAKLGQLVQLMALREPVYMKGPAGSGKSTAAEMAAESFGLDYYHVGKVDSKYDLIGFVDANGNYQSSSLYTAYKNGGVFLWDEVDASAPDALTAFLNLIEGRSFEFPCGKVEKHADFRPIAAGNTSMLGGTAEYSGRTRQDGAFKDRFCEIEWGYDEDLEKALYGSAAVTVQEIRARAEKNGIRHIISPRASRRLQKLLEVYPRNTAVELAVRNGLDSDTWGRICK